MTITLINSLAIKRLAITLLGCAIFVFSGCDQDDASDDEGDDYSSNTSNNNTNINCDRLSGPAECGAHTNCQYFWNWRKPVVGKCLPKNTPKKTCEKIDNNVECELSGIATEKCVYAGICQPFSNFNASGFSSKNDFHLNGKMVDDHGFDAKGYDIKGFNNAGLHKETKTLFNLEGFNAQGFDNQGFNEAGLHMDTNTPYNPAGFNARGFNNQGFNAAGFHQETNTAYNRAGFNSRGFNNLGIHQATNTIYDANGFNVLGFNDQGYNERGFNQRGFNQLGIHEVTNNFRNPAGFDANGLNAGGYNERGYNHLGFDVQGFNERGFNDQGAHRSGLEAFSMVEGRNVGVDERGHDWTDTFVGLPEGFDRDGNFIGYSPSLNFSPVGTDERYNKAGFNQAGHNFLGLTQAQWTARRFDAILDLPEVQAYPNDLTQLITNFNLHCYDLQWYDVLDMDWKNLRADRIAEDPAGVNESLIDTYMNSPLDRTADEYEMVRLVGGAGVARSEADVKADLIPYLKKGIYFCQRFLYAGALTKNDLDFANFNVDRGSALTQKMPAPDYVALLADLQRVQNLDYIQVIKTALEAADVLAGAQYDEIGDQLAYGTGPVTFRYNNAAGDEVEISHNFGAGLLDQLVPPNIPGHPLVMWNNAVSRQGIRGPLDPLGSHFSMTLDAYADGAHGYGRGKNYDQSRFYLRLMAGKLAAAGGVSLVDKQAVAGLFSHGGAHCPDAKRKAIEDSARLLDLPAIERIEQETLAKVGTENIRMVTIKSLAPEKYKLYEAWLMTYATNGGVGDVMSGFAAMWNKFNVALGLAEVENAYPFMANNGLPFDNFFNPKANVPAGTAVTNAGYSKQKIYNALYPKAVLPGEPNAPMLDQIRSFVFGPLWAMKGDQNDVQVTIEGRSTKEHPIVKALLLRLGILNKNP